MKTLLNNLNIPDFVELYEVALETQEENFFFCGEEVSVKYAARIVNYVMPTKLEHNIAATIRNPENYENCVLMPVLYDGIRTAAICIIEDGVVSPMVVIVNDKMFKSVKPLQDITDFLSNLK